MIDVHGLSVTYAGGVEAIKDVSMTFTSNEFVVVVGLSGAGKSTLLRTFNGLVPPTDGDVVTLGLSVASASSAELRRLRRDIGMIFQSFHVVKRSSVLRNVLAGRVGYVSPWRTLLSLWPRKDVNIAWSCLERVGIADKGYVRSDRLSGGQQQRVGIARALAQRPKVLLADEPVASLDPRTARAIMRDLKEIQRTDGILTIVNLHSIELAQEFADRMIGLRDGRIVFDGPAKDVTKTTLMNIYGDVERFWIGANFSSPEKRSIKNSNASSAVVSDGSSTAKGAPEPT